jgi:hypothetical protein
MPAWLIVQAGGVSLDRNAPHTVYLLSSSTSQYTLNSAASSGTVAGTWANRGAVGEFYLMERTA